MIIPETAERDGFQRSLLEAVLETGNEGILVVGHAGEVLLYNRRFAEMWGIPEQVLGVGQDESLIASVLDQLADPDGFRARVAYLYDHPFETSSDRIELTDGRVFDRYSAPVSLGTDPPCRVWFFRDNTGLLRAEEDLRRRVRELESIYEMIDGVTRSDDVDEICRLAITGLVHGANVPRASVLLFDETGQMRFQAWHGLSEGYRRAVDGHSPWGRDSVDATPILVADAATDPSLEGLRDHILGEGIGALAFVPLKAGGALLGKFMLYWNEPHDIGDHEIRFAEAVGRHIAIALERRRREDVLRTSEERARLALEGTGTGVWEWDLVADVVSWSPNLGPLHGLPWGSAPPSSTEFFALVAPEDQEVVGEAVRRAMERGEDYTVEFRTVWPDGTRRWIESSAHVIRPDGAPTRVVGVSRDITDRKRAEQAQTLLNRVTEVLGSALEYRSRVEQLAEVFVPSFADGCAVMLADDDGTFVPGTLAHRDPDIHDRMRALGRRYSMAGREGHPLWQVVNTRQPVLIPRVDEGWIDRAASDREHAQALASFGVTSAMMVPLMAQDVVRGAISIWREGGGEPYDEADLAVMQEVARRAALAIENARLYEAEFRSREEAREAADRVRRLQQITSALSQCLTVREVADVLVTRGAAAVAAAAAWVGTVDTSGAPGSLGASGVSDEMAVAAANAMTEADGDGEDGLWLSSPDEIVDALALAPDRVRSLAAMPIETPDGRNGTVVFAFDRPRRLSPEDRALLVSVVEQCEQAFERARLFEWERSVARTLQASILPARLPSLAGVSLDGRYLPSTREIEVGGDWYEVVPLPDDRVVLAIGDVVGRGVAAASAMGQFSNALRAYAMEGYGPAELLMRLNRLARDVPGGVCTTAACAVLDRSTGSMQYAIAGHPPLLLLHPDGRQTFLNGDRSLPLGVDIGWVYGESTIEVEPGATLLLYTDGIVERRSRALDDGLELLARTAGEARGHAGDLVDHLLNTMVGRDREDDIALLAITLTEARAETFRREAPPDPNELAPLRRELRRWLTRVGMESRRIDDLLVACGEVAANAVEHSGSESRFVLQAERTNGSVAVVVQDEGTWRPPAATVGRGLGLRLARALVDEITVQPSETGTRVSIRHRLRDAAT